MALENLFLDYFFEEYGRETIINEHGFISYSFHNGTECLLGDFYIKPESRKSFEAKKLFSQVKELAKAKGYKYLTGIVATSDERAEKASKIMRTYLALGFMVMDARNGHMCFRMDIE